jgi:Domain of unknown function (DUF4160)
MNVYVHNMLVVKVLSRNGIRVYVYREVGQPHHLPHCDVRWSDGSTTKVALPSLLRLAGKELTPQARRLLKEHVDTIWKEWDRLNPQRVSE